MPTLACYRVWIMATGTKGGGANGLIPISRVTRLYQNALQLSGSEQMLFQAALQTTLEEEIVVEWFKRHIAITVQSHRVIHDDYPIDVTLDSSTLQAIGAANVVAALQDLQLMEATGTDSLSAQPLPL